MFSQFLSTGMEGSGGPLCIAFNLGGGGGGFEFSFVLRIYCGSPEKRL